MKREELIEFFQRESGKSYDPAIVAAFVENLPRLEQAGRDVGSDEEDPWGIREQFKKETPVLRPLENAQPILIYSKTLRGDGQSQRDLFSVFEFARADIHYLSAKDVLTFMGGKLTDLITFDAGVFYVADLESSTVVAKHVVGPESGPLLNFSMSLEQKLSGWAAANNESLPNLPPEPDFSYWEGEKPTFQFSIVAPMNTGKVVLGAVTLYRKSNTKFTDEERRRLELVASQTGVALSKCGKSNQDNAMVDSLTGLPNGYQLYFMFDQVAIDASRFDYTIALLSIRLDDAKLRRRWGHAVGDEAVRSVATYLSKEIRETDLLVRYANDEFIILVPRVDLEKAEGLKSRFQDELDHFRFQVRPGTYASLPVSIGISMFPSDGSTLDALISSAEWRMQEDAELRVAVKSGLRSLPPNS
jgi:diguanylate cyclase (GGDEF)-like protein